MKRIINPDCCFSVGLNVDRDHITLVVVDFVGRVRARASREIAFANPSTVRRFYQRSVGQLLAKAGIARAHLPDQPGEYAGWASVRVDDLIRDVLRIPVFVENDAAAAAIGEMQFGFGQKFRSFFYVLISAALGAGLVEDGSYVRGATGRSA